MAPKSATFSTERSGPVSAFSYQIQQQVEDRRSLGQQLQ